MNLPINNSPKALYQALDDYIHSDHMRSATDEEQLNAFASVCALNNEHRQSTLYLGWQFEVYAQKLFQAGQYENGMDALKMAVDNRMHDPRLDPCWLDDDRQDVIDFWQEAKIRFESVGDKEYVNICLERLGAIKSIPKCRRVNK